MRILLWTELFWPYIGGGEVLSAKFAVAMKSRGHQLAVITSHGNLDLPDEDDYQGIPVYRFDFWEALSKRKVDLLVRARQRVASLKRLFRPEIVHIFFTDPSVFFHLQTSEAFPAPMLLSLHIGLPQRVNSEILSSCEHFTQRSGSRQRRKRCSPPPDGLCLKSFLILPVSIMGLSVQACL